MFLKLTGASCNADDRRAAAAATVAFVNKDGANKVLKVRDLNSADCSSLCQMSNLHWRRMRIAGQGVSVGPYTSRGSCRRADCWIS